MILIKYIGLTLQLLKEAQQLFHNRTCTFFNQ